MNNCIAPHAKPTTTINKSQLCETHYQRIPSYIQEILSLYALLDELLEPGSQGSSNEPTSIRGSRETPVPIRLEAVILRDPRSKPFFEGNHAPAATLTIMSAWATLIREELNLTEPAHPTLSSEAGTLITHWDWIATQSWVGDFINEIMQAHRHLLDATNYEPRHVRVGTCTQALEEETPCGGSLYVTTAGTARCSRCHHTHDIPLFQVEAAMQLLNLPSSERRSAHARHAATIRWASS